MTYEYFLFLDDIRYPGDAFTGPKQPVLKWHIARSTNDAQWYVKNYGVPQFISFDHDLGALDDTGYDFAKWLIDYLLDNNKNLPQGFSYYVHSQNPVGRKNIQSLMDNYMGVENNG